MKRAIWVSVAVIVAVTLLVVAGARSLLVDDQPTGDPVAVEKQVAQRPDCPAGLDLPCLGGEVAGEAKEITVVNVWAWWCEPCRAELPYLQKVAETHPEWQVVGVHADKNAGNGAAFLNDVGVDLPSFQDADNKFAGQLSLPGVVPVTVVLKDGEVRKQFAQPFSSAAEIERAVKEAIAA